MDFELKTMEDLSAKLFNPFEINNNDIYYPLCDIDPDAHYFNESDAHISQNCNYYYEHSFLSVIQSMFPNIIDHCAILTLEVKKLISDHLKYV